MPLQEHLKELRRRILICVSVIFLFSLVSAPLAPLIVDRIANDLLDGISFYVFSPQEATIVYLKVSAFTAIVFAFPIILWHIWAFISPGLINNERRFLFRILFISILLFLTGAIFAYYILLPVALKFLINISYMSSVPVFNLNQTLTFILLTILLFGFIFQLPLIITILTNLGLVDYKILAGNRAYVIIITLICAAIVTDPSVFTQILVAVPIIVLYEISILISKFVKK